GDTPIVIHANAGLPKTVNGEDVFPETPDQMAAQVPEIVAAGVNIVGGCCGTTPDHIEALRRAVKALETA
ncbi:MAG: homocysteine S-methyltransferase family protein, partial [Candidatus Pacebacteria bacterium]|nr:homocysteine S-methyltransferase family protein [Candidatus Paceibacterota bacterium]